MPIRYATPKTPPGEARTQEARAHEARPGPAAGPVVQRPAPLALVPEGLPPEPPADGADPQAGYAAPPAAPGGPLAPGDDATAARPERPGAPAPEARPPAPPDRGAPPERVTPMIAQFIEIKAANPDCLLFYRMGDFYELFFEDAEVASRALGIVLTRRGRHGGKDIAMCGVPVERAEEYLGRLIARGHRVAVCEQLEDPAEAKKRGAKAVVRRDVTRLVTPGTVTEDALLDARAASRLVALARVEGVVGVAALDVSTGRVTVEHGAPEAAAAALARLAPREVVGEEGLLADPVLAAPVAEGGAVVSRVPGEAGPAAERRLREAYGVATLDGFGALAPAEVAALATALAYLERAGRGRLPPLMPPEALGTAAGMAIDAATRANLEVARSLAGAPEGGLLHAIDRTLTAGGARLLAEDLGGPLTEVAAIDARLDAVARLRDDPALAARLRAALRALPDAPRALARLGTGRGGPRDLAALRDAAGAAAALARALAGADLPPLLAGAARDLGAIDPVLPDALGAALADAPPLQSRDGGFLRSGFDPALDAARDLRDASRRVVAALQARLAEETGCRALRIKHTGQLGYFVEVPQAAGERLREDPAHRAQFAHRQSMAGAMRFSTAELADLESRIAGAAGEALAIELAHFERLTALALEHAPALRAAHAAASRLDVSASHASVAEAMGWCRPLVTDGLDFRVEGGRHPVVEAALRARGEPFVANDAALGEAGAAAGRVLLVTGPNMAGKSTFLRQNALLAVLAQAGSFVPARAATLGVVDRLYSRVGASDDLARGRSTFMVEMVEAAAILNGATPRSLVILDEIGRGTATHDGLAIAQACLEHLHDANRCRALFATHFRELANLTGRLGRLAPITMRVAEWEGGVVFLHEVAEGVAARSYGVQVARLAGLPASVVARAGALLEGLEREGPRRRAAPAPLPLFPPAAPPPAPPPAAAPPHPALERLRALDPDAMTPREALDALYALKRAAV